MQSLVPPEMLGRASSVDALFSFCLAPIGVLVAGVVAAAIGVRTTLIAGGVIGAMTTLVVFVPGVRDPERVEPVAEAADAALVAEPSG